MEIATIEIFGKEFEVLKKDGVYYPMLSRWKYAPPKNGHKAHHYCYRWVEKNPIPEHYLKYIKELSIKLPIREVDFITTGCVNLKRYPLHYWLNKSCRRYCR